MKYADKINETASDTFRYLNFDQMGDYVKTANTVDLGPEYKTALQKEVEKIKSRN